MIFKNWLNLAESAAIADQLKNQNKDVVKQYKNVIRGFLSARMPSKSLDLIVNFFTYLYLLEQLDINQVSSQINNDWQKYGAYISAKINQRSLFVSVFTRENLEAENVIYHRDIHLSKKNRRKGPQGKAIVDVFNKLTESNLSSMDPSFNPNAWKGWQWVSLGCGYSKEEGAAAGHCGNQGNAKGDNVVSLRDPSNKVHLTFIVNVLTGELGEAKGTDNEKPNKSYHPAIVTLLLSGYIKKYKGGGYLPENNFNIDDLDEKVKKIVEDFLSGREDFSKPENYHSIDWTDQWTQEKVDNLDIKQKIELLESIINLHSNHKVFDTYQYNHDAEKGENIIPSAKELNFDFNNLISSVTPYLKNNKKVIHFLDSLYEINNYNKISTGHELFNKIRPDLPQDSKEEHRIKDSWHIEDSTLKKLANKSVELVLSGSLRDKIELSDVLVDLGHEEDPNDWKKDWNIYQDSIDKLDKASLAEIAEKGLVKRYYDDMPNLVYRNTKESPKYFEYAVFTKDGKKATYKFNHYLIKASFRLNDKKDKYSTVGMLARKDIKDILPKMKPYLIKNGYSEYLGSNKLEDYILDSVYEHLLIKFVNTIKSKYNDRFYVKKDDVKDFVVKFMQDSTECLELLLKHQKNTVLFMIDKKLREDFEITYHKIRKNIPKIIQSDIKNIIDKTNNPKQYDYGKSKYVTAPRPDIRRHRTAPAFEGFTSWLDRRTIEN